MTNRDRELTVKDANELAELLVPRLEQAIAPRFAELSDKIDSVRTDVNGLKAHCSLWGALAGAVSALVAALPGMLGGPKNH